MFRFVLLCLVIAASASQAVPRFAHQQAEAFAVCSGRMSALAARQGADRDPAAIQSALLGQEFDLLLDAVIDAAYAQGVPPQEPMRWKARGWSELAGALRARDSDPAALDRQIADCRALVLPS